MKQLEIEPYNSKLDYKKPFQLIYAAEGLDIMYVYCCGSHICTADNLLESIEKVIDYKYEQGKRDTQYHVKKAIGVV